MDTRKIALITGASRGVGAATALAFARRGVGCALLVRRPETAAALRQDIEDAGAPCCVVRCDISNDDEVRSAVQTVVQTFGRIDYVINNAGQLDPIGHIAEAPAEPWVRTVTVNLLGAYFVVRATLAHLMASQGAIVNLSSGAASNPREGWSAYCSSKAALAMFTRCIAHEYTEKGVSVYGFRPGGVDTGMQEAIRASGMNPVSKVPREKLHSPERVGQAIAWLAQTMPPNPAGAELSIGDPMFESCA